MYKEKELTLKGIDALLEKFQKLEERLTKKKDKENAKMYVEYKGEKYHTEEELFDAYSCDAMSMKTYERLLDKLETLGAETATDFELKYLQGATRYLKSQRDLESGMYD